LPVAYQGGLDVLIPRAPTLYVILNAIFGLLHTQLYRWNSHEKKWKLGTTVSKSTVKMGAARIWLVAVGIVIHYFVFTSVLANANYVFDFSKQFFAGGVVSIYPLSSYLFIARRFFFGVMFTSVLHILYQRMSRWFHLPAAAQEGEAP